MLVLQTYCKPLNVILYFMNISCCPVTLRITKVYVQYRRLLAICKGQCSMSAKLICSMETTTRGLILYHHFMQCVDKNQYDENMVAAVSLNISSKINEQPIEIDALLCVFFSIVNKTTEVLSPDDVAFVILKQSLITVEYLVLRMLEFTTNHCLAHQFLVPFLTLIFERCKNIAEFRNELSKTCIRILSDFYTTKSCMNYVPQHMAIACIDLSLYIHGFTNDMVMIPVWYQGFCSDISSEKVKQIKKDMMALYQGPKALKIKFSEIEHGKTQNS